jgi:hypothetical protein
MSYYGSDLDTAEASFDDPTAELEIQAEADDPEGDLGDGAAQGAKRRKLRSLEGVDADLIRSRGLKGL